MKCRSCGTEIADKAIVCYRCGTGTTDPVRRPVPIPSSRPAWPAFVIRLVATLAAVAIVMAVGRSDHPGPLELTGAVVAAAAIVLVTLRLSRRR